MHDCQLLDKNYFASIKQHMCAAATAKLYVVIKKLLVGWASSVLTGDSLPVTNMRVFHIINADVTTKPAERCIRPSASAHSSQRMVCAVLHPQTDLG